MSVTSDPGRSLHRSAEITVRLPVEQAMVLFTAEGERVWADGWDPAYPDPARRDGAGAVFTTADDGHAATWIMVDQAPDRVRYARVAHGLNAGTVAVEVVASDESTTRVRVTYDLTALGPVGAAMLSELDAGYEAEIASWGTAIASAVERSH